MNCISCKVVVPVAFTKAITENLCPACGKDIMPVKIYKEFKSVKDMLSTSEIDDSNLTKISILLIEKYDLVPKGTARQISNQNKTASSLINRLDSTDVEEVVEEESIDFSTLPPEEAAMKMAEVAAKEAEAEDLIKEWGLEEGQYSVAALSKKSSPKADLTQMASLFNNDNSASQQSNDFVKGPKMDAFTANRLARLAALKDDPSYGKISRLDD